MKTAPVLTKKLLALLLALACMGALCGCRIEFSDPAKKPDAGTDSRTEETTEETPEETTETSTEASTEASTEETTEQPAPQVVEIELSKKGVLTLYYYVDSNSRRGESIHHVKKCFARIAKSQYTQEISVDTLRDSYDSIATDNYYDLIYVIYDMPNYPYYDEDKVVPEKFGVLSGYQYK